MKPLAWSAGADPNAARCAAHDQLPRDAACPAGSYGVIMAFHAVATVAGERCRIVPKGRGMARLRVALLGPPDVRHGDRRIVVPTRKALALLVFLVAESAPQPRDKLAVLFWPESVGDAARSSLRSTLTRLGQGLADAGGDRHLVAGRDLVALDPAAGLDLDLDVLAAAHEAACATGADRPTGDARRALVARLRRGADAWRGEFADGFALPDAPDFDEWIGLQRETWRRRAEVVLDQLSALHADAGEAASAAEAVDRWLRLNPLEERAHRRLMRVRAAAGDRAGALAAFERCRLLLAAELGVEPDPETARLADRIRTAGPHGSGAARPARRTAPDAPPEPPLVGRIDEFAALSAGFREAARGRPRAVVLHGEAGIGKTTLAAAFAAWAAAHGADLLHGRAFAAGAHAPYQPLVDALRQRLERDPAPLAALGPAWLGELSRLLPELRDRWPNLPTPLGDEAAARIRLFETVARLAQALAARAPLVVVIDDVQWSDPASLDVLHYAARRWGQDGTPALLLCCIRAEAMAGDPALGEWLAGLGRAIPVERIALGPLAAAETAELVRGLGMGRAPERWAESVAPRIHAETAGQPFYVVETVRALLERPATEAASTAEGDPPAVLPGIQRLIESRLAPLPPAARDLLTAGAVLGQRFTFDVLRQVARLSDDEALPALDAALRALLLQDGDDRDGETTYLFTHDTIRDVVHAGAGSARRRVFHRRAVAALEAAGAPAAVLVGHARAGGLVEETLRFGCAAGDEAMRLLAARDAAAHFELAIGAAEKMGRRGLLPELRMRRGRAFVAMGAWASARAEFAAALADLGPDDAERRAEALTDAAEAAWWDLDIPAVLRQATAALAFAAGTGRGDLETRAVAWQAAAEGALGDLPRCGELIACARRRAADLGIPAPTIVGHYHPLTLYWLGRPHEALPLAQEAVALATERNDVPWLMTALPNLGLALAATGRYGEAVARFAEVRRVGREYGQDALLARAIAISTGFHNELLDAASAEPLAREARDLALTAGFLPPAVSAGIDLLVSLARREEIGETERLIDEVAAAIQDTGGFHAWQWRMRLVAVRAEIALARGDAAGALAWADETIDQSRARGRPKYEVYGLFARARQRIGIGCTREAIADLRAALAIARGVGDPALLLRPAAALLALDGNDDLAAEARAAACAIARALPDDAMRERFLASPEVRRIVGAR